jgi:glutaredoxin 3
MRARTGDNDPARCNVKQIFVNAGILRVPKVEIYTSMLCGYCHAAKRLLKQKHVEYIEYDAGGDSELRAKMMERAGGRTTVPQIFIDGTHIGGCDELYALEHAGKLAPLLGENPP